MGKMPNDPVDRFFAFMRERESIRLKKLAGDPWPWTKDPILQSYKFTNVKREHDRTSQLLIREFYKPNFNAPRMQLLLNCAIARYFGTIEFMRAIGWQSEFNPSFLKRIASERMKDGLTVFTGAYIITSGGIVGPKQDYVVDHVLTPLIRKHSELLRQWTHWEHFITRLMRVPGFGGSSFMAKEVTLDLRYTSFWTPGTPRDKNTWTPIGPGSMRGSARIKGDNSGEKADHKTTQETCVELFKQHKKFWPRNYVELELHDIQFQLCEWDKYERTRLKQGRPRSKYKPPSAQGVLL